MKIPLGKIAAWISRALLAAAIDAAADRLSRAPAQHRRDGGQDAQRKEDRLDQQ